MHIKLFQETAYFQAGIKYVQNDPEILLRNNQRFVRSCEIERYFERVPSGRTGDKLCIKITVVTDNILSQIGNSPITEI